MFVEIEGEIEGSNAEAATGTLGELSQPVFITEITKKLKGRKQYIRLCLLLALSATLIPQIHPSRVQQTEHGNTKVTNVNNT